MTDTEPEIELASSSVENIEGLHFDDVVTFVDRGLRKNMPGDTPVFGHVSLILGSRATRLDCEETP